MRAVLAALVVAACTHPVPPLATATKPPVDAAVATAPPADAPEASQEERLAAIQKAMNDLDGVAHQCWASVAVERFDIEGNLEARIAIAAHGAQVEIVTDTTRTPKLVACMSKVLAAYAWAPPLSGQTIQLPFRFRAPDGQSVIERLLVPAAAQGGVSVGVLLDEANTGNDAASMFELAIAPQAATGLRAPDRTELWYFETPARINGTALDAGDMMFVPPGAAREVVAAAAEVRAMVVVTPGGREGAARAGALPTRSVGAPTKLAPVFLRASAADRLQPVQGTEMLFAEPRRTKSPALAASILELPRGYASGEHVHAKETELLYVLAGIGTLTVNGVTLPLTATSVAQVPAGAKHVLAATSDLRAVHLFTPAGPEQELAPHEASPMPHGPGSRGHK